MDKTVKVCVTIAVIVSWVALAAGQGCMVGSDCLSECRTSCFCMGTTCVSCQAANQGGPCTTVDLKPGICQTGVCTPLTSAPTFAPTVAPSPSPTVTPTTALPTETPTETPSVSPSLRPTETPSAAPSFQPTASPSTAQPTNAPVTAYVILTTTVINGNATVTTLSISSNATLVVTGTAALSGTLLVSLDSKPLPGQSVSYDVLSAGLITGNFASLNVTAPGLNPRCESLVAESAVNGNSLGITVSLAANCGLGPGPIAGISLALVVVVVAVALLLSKLRLVRQKQWTVAQNAELARQGAEEAMRPFRDPVQSMGTDV